MRRRDLLAGLGALAATPKALSSNAWAKDNLAPQTLRYARTHGAEADLQSLDLYGAARGQKLPVIAYIHGGGWAVDDKATPAHGREKAAFFVPKGFIYASLNYRLSPRVAYPAHVQDCAAGVGWLYKNASAYGGDPDRLFVMGHSAGAELAALVATDERRLAAYDLPLSIIRGVLAIDGAGYDLPSAIPKALLRVDPLMKWYFDAFGRDPGKWPDASPTHHVAPGKGIAPFLLAHSSWVEAEQTDIMAAALSKAGIPNEVVVSPDQDHAGIIEQFGTPGDIVAPRVMARLKAWGA